MKKQKVLNGEVVSYVEFHFDVGENMALDRNTIRIKTLRTKEGYLRRGYATELLLEIFEEYHPKQVRVHPRADRKTKMHLNQRELEAFYAKFETDTMKVVLEYTRPL